MMNFTCAIMGIVHTRKFVAMMVSTVVLAACTQSSATRIPAPTAPRQPSTAFPTLAPSPLPTIAPVIRIVTPTAEPSPAVTPSATPAPPTAEPSATPQDGRPALRVAFLPGLPEPTQNALRTWLGRSFNVQMQDNPAQAEVRLGPQPTGKLIYEQVWAATAPFYTLQDEVGGNALVAALGQASRSVQVSPSFGVSLVPFDQLAPSQKLLRVDGVNLFDRAASLQKYPLVLRVFAQGGEAALSRITPSTNRDVSKMAVVAMTGVTAMARVTAMRMRDKGLSYPGQKIRDWLTNADLTHISNEVSFDANCPSPTPDEGTLFCSKPEYIELLKYVGTDVIELTGNHLWDYGADKLKGTLDTYDKLGWRYFGGGRNYADALKPLTLTVNENRIAFVGCNYWGVDWATDRVPGSARCGRNNPYALDLITPTIASLAQQGYSVIATIQYAEYYTYEAPAQQQADFRALREAGAVVVNGSQGHHVQGFDVTDKGFIHYGVGNLFFGDQLEEGAKKMFVDRHIFYNGRYLGVELKAGQIEDWSQPRPMTQAEREALLKTLFAVSR